MNESINQVGYKGKFEDKWAQFTERYWLQISISYSNFQWPIVLKYNLIVLSFNFAKTNSTTTFSLFRWLMWSDVPNICLFNWRTGIINFWPLLQTHTQNRMSHLCVMFSWLWFPRCGNWQGLRKNHWQEVHFLFLLPSPAVKLKAFYLNHVWDLLGLESSSSGVFPSQSSVLVIWEFE